jgi:integrase/recombinase XerD
MTPFDAYLGRWPAGSDTHRTLRSALNRTASVLSQGRHDGASYPWHALRYESAGEVPAKLQEAGLSTASVNKALVALRGVLEAAWRLGTIPDEAYRRIEIKNVRGKALPAGRALDTTETSELGASMGEVPARDAALIAVLFACGLRRIEAARLRQSDYDPKARRLRAQGKGGKERSVPVPKEWTGVIEMHWRSLEPDAPFFSSRQGPLTRAGISFVVDTFCKTTGIPRFTPHDLRRTFASTLAGKVDLLVLKRLMGHASLDTTAIYDRRGEEAESAAVNLIKKG